jgi:hypothetical protein
VDWYSPALTALVVGDGNDGGMAAGLGRRGLSGGPGGRGGRVRDEGRLREAMCKVEDSRGDLLRPLWTNGRSLGASGCGRLQSAEILREKEMISVLGSAQKRGEGKSPGTRVSCSLSRQQRPKHDSREENSGEKSPLIGGSFREGKDWGTGEG